MRSSPYALKVPVDNVTLSWNVNGELGLKEAPIPNRVLGANGAGALTWIDLTGAGLGDMVAGIYDGIGGTRSAL